VQVSGVRNRPVCDAAAVRVLLKALMATA